MANTKNLGPSQYLVILCLGDDEKSVRTLGGDHPALTEGSVRAALSRLYRRGLVEPARFEGNTRTWKLSNAGAEYLAELGEAQDLLDQMEEEDAQADSGWEA